MSAAAAPLVVNLTSREESRQFYRTVYAASENVPMGFTGDVTAGRAGDLSPAFKEAVRLRVNFFRAFAGLPGEITFNAAYSAKCQQAALLGSLNNSISHTPPSSSLGYTADAAEAAAKSNIALVEFGPSAIVAYMRDSGANNRDVGHRRWVLYPQTREMGTGDVPATGSRNAANALWILDAANVSGPRPATRESYIAWPPPGHVPHPLVFARWSIAVDGANFSQAFVNVRRNGTPVLTTVDSLKTGFGENAIVWALDGQDPSSGLSHDRPAADTVYAVEISNVLVGGGSQTYRYSVTVYDPDAPTVGSGPVRVTGPGDLVAGRTGTYTVTAPSFFPRLQWRSLQLTDVAPRFDAESGAQLGGLVADLTSYDPVVTDLRGAGAAGFRLIHPPPVQTEHTLTLPDTYFAPNPAATLSFLSRLGYATSRQSARVQISTDDGRSWTDVFRQTGDGTSGEQSFRSQTISLASLERQTFKVRFNYTLVTGGSFFNQSDPGVGWYFDDIALTGVRKATPANATDLTGTSFTFAPASAAELGVQARGLIDVHPGEWSSVTLATMAAAPGTGTPGTGTPDSGGTVALTPTGTSARLANLSVRANAGRDDAALVVGFSVTGAAAKPIFVRAVGPTLGLFGVTGVLTDPLLSVKDGSGAAVSENDNWGGAAAITSAATRLGAFQLDAASRDSAVLPTLGAGAYTATVTPSGASAPGVALVELYDADVASPSRLANVSARAPVGTGSDVLVIGFAVGGTGNRNVLIRAIGPTLAAFGVSGTLADPRFEVLRDGVLVSANDNWNAARAPVFASVGAFALTPGSADAALALALAPGTYTVQVSGAGTTTGAALVEVYELP